MMVQHKYTNIIFKTLLTLLIIAIFSFNDLKIVLYPIKIIFIFAMLVIFLLNLKKINVYFVWSCLFLLLCLPSILWVSNQFNALYDYIWLLQAFAILILITSFLDNKSDLFFLLNLIIIGSFILVIRIVVFTPFDDWGNYRLGHYVGYNPNVIGVEMIISIMILVNYLSTSKGIKKIFISILILLFIVILFFTGSRKSFLGLLISLSFYILLRSSNVLKTIKMSIIVIILISLFWYLIMNIPLFYEILGFRMEKLFEVLKGEDTNIRFEMIEVALDLFKEKPLIGHGIGQFTQKGGFNTYSHINYLEILVNHGMIGFLIYYSMYFYLLISCFKYMKKDRNFIFIISLLFMLLFLEIGIVSYRDLYLLIILAISYSYQKIAKKTECKNIIIYGKG